MMLLRNNCDRVKSCLAQIESTVASIVFGSRNPVNGSDSFNVRPPPLWIVEYIASLPIGAAKAPNGEICTVVTLIFPFRCFANDLCFTDVFILLTLLNSVVFGVELD